MAGMAKFFLALVLLAPFLSDSSVYAAEKVKVATPTTTNPFNYLPLIAAQEKGFWVEQGLEAEATLLASTVPLMAAIVGGSVFSGVQSTTGTLGWIYRGVPLVIIADMGARPPWYVWVRKESPVKTPADLKGGKIGVTRLGSLTHAYSLAFARAAGLERDIKIVATGGIASTIAGLKTGIIDATLLLGMTMLPLEQEGVVRRLVPLAEYAPSDEDTLTVFATQEAVAKRPEVVKKIVAGLLKGMDFTMKNAAWATQTMKTQGRMTDPVASAVFKMIYYSGDGRIIRTRLEKLSNFLIEYRLVAAEKPLPVERFYSKDFVPVE